MTIKKDNFNMPLRYNLFNQIDKKHLGQICRKSWQNGAIVTYSGFVNPQLIFGLFVSAENENALFVPGMKGKDNFGYHQY